MSLKSAEKTEKNVTVLEIEVDAETFEKAVDDVFKKNAEKINVPGFRKGKAPRKIIERMYGEGVFYEDAIEATYPQAYEAAVKEAGISPVDHPKIDVVSVGKEGYVIKATVTTKPEVKVKNYKGIKVEKTIVEVTDEDINSEIDRIRQRNARLAAVEGRSAQKDDTAVIDFEGFVDGLPFEGGKGENHNLKLGSGQFIPGFEDQLIGKNVGDEVDVNVTFPEEYHEKSLSGKPAVFKVKINELKYTELPEADDDFAKDVSEFNTLAEYKDSIKTKITEAKEHEAENEVEDKLISEVIANMEAEIPEVMFERQLENIASDYDAKMRQQGLDLESYLKYSGSDMESFKKMFREQAERQVKIRLALEEIAKQEKIPVSDEEINEEYQKIADSYQMDAKKVKDYIPQEELVKDIVVGKAIELIKSSAEITEVKAEAKAAEADNTEKKPAKKSKKKADAE